MKLFDSLKNIVANLGTDRDKAAHSYYAPTLLNDQQLMDAYRYAWLPRKIIEAPAKDATRNWRGWQGDKKQIALLEAEEKRLGLRHKVRDAMFKARTLGGAAIVIGPRTSSEDIAKPIQLDSIGRGGIPYLLVMSRLDLTAGEIENDPMQPGYGLPKWYTPKGNNAVQMHPSRVVRFIGSPLPDASSVGMNINQGWGDSVLNSVYTACMQHDGTMANVASLVFEAKVDVFRVPGLLSKAGDPRYRELFLQRTQLAALAKGINGTLLMDKEEEYESKTQAFGGLDAIIDRFMQTAAGAADIPLTRLMGVTSKGLGNAGESDISNYYDSVRAHQELEIEPAMAMLDECLIRSALGNRPGDLHYVWRSLWQTTPKEQADIGKTTADTIKTISDTKLVNPDALAQAAVNALVEASVLPGLAEAVDDHAGSDQPEPETDRNPANLADAAPRPLYVSRKVVNGAAILRHFTEQGVTPVLAADDLHVTIAYSRDAVDWMKIPSDWAAEADGKMNVPAGGPRVMDKFGEALVLLFSSWRLSSRHGDMREAGASWDHADYQPHITIAYNADHAAESLKPYSGPIELGPEIFETLDENWSEGKA